MPNNKNLQAVQELREKVKKAKSIVVTDYKGLSANEVNDLRQKVRDSGAEISVAKNSLLEIALKEEGYNTQEIAQDLKGPSATVFSYEDAINPIKALFEFAKKSELPKVKAGFVEGTYLNGVGMESISKLPSKMELIAKVLGTMKSPLSGLVNSLSGTNKKVVYALAEIAKKKEVL